MAVIDPCHRYYCNNCHYWHIVVVTYRWRAPIGAHSSTLNRARVAILSDAVVLVLDGSEAWVDSSGVGGVSLAMGSDPVRSPCSRRREAIPTN